ncbi:hypothetical protein H5410_028724 [Solanum commersonii]|uniref:Uncharacterized protein n=1 Tax=Solanum commersonii TaxID=4109 RepID=A0A9J5Z5M4_SOLCO|nr:hypothetical protein H5410_028724 [Solanum commersonii]
MIPRIVAIVVVIAVVTVVVIVDFFFQDERDLNAIQDVVEAPTPTIEMVGDENLRFEQFLARHKKNYGQKCSF